MSVMGEGRERRNRDREREKRKAIYICAFYVIPRSSLRYPEYKIKI